MNIYVDPAIYRYPDRDARLKLDIESRDYIRMALLNAIFPQYGIIDVRFGLNDVDECICVARDGDFILVYFSERGGRNFIAAFDSLFDAAEYVFWKYKSGQPFPIDWPHVAAQIDAGITDPHLITPRKED